MKHCKRCGRDLPLDNFYHYNGKAQHPCKDCRKKIDDNPEARARKSRNRRIWHLKTLYGITMEFFDYLLFDKQGLRCAICDEFLPEKDSQIAIDHNHITGKIRGLLCHQCNFGLGNFKDSPEILRSAATYLERTADEQYIE